MWTSKPPFWLPPRWPFNWWLVVLADQFSAKILQIEIFPTRPSTEDVRALVRRAIKNAGVVPKHLITDKGEQFRNSTFRPWCRGIGIRHGYGTLGQFGSIPFIERLIRTIKWEWAERIFVPLSASAARRELALFKDWYNRIRTHERLRGATPDEVLTDGIPIAMRARGPFESNATRLALRVRHFEGRRHLPIIELERAA